MDPSTTKVVCHWSFCVRLYVLYKMQLFPRGVLLYVFRRISGVIIWRLLAAFPTNQNVCHYSFNSQKWLANAAEVLLRGILSFAIEQISGVLIYILLPIPRLAPCQTLRLLIRPSWHVTLCSYKLIYFRKRLVLIRNECCQGKLVCTGTINEWCKKSTKKTLT